MFVNPVSLLLTIQPPYQLVWSTEEIVGWIPHQIDTGGTVEIGKSSCHNGKVSQAGPYRSDRVVDVLLVHLPF